MVGLKIIFRHQLKPRRFFCNDLLYRIGRKSNPNSYCLMVINYNSL